METDGKSSDGYQVLVAPPLPLCKVKWWIPPAGAGESDEPTFQQDIRSRMDGAVMSYVPRPFKEDIMSFMQLAVLTILNPETSRVSRMFPRRKGATTAAVSLALATLRAHKHLPRKLVFGDEPALPLPRVCLAVFHRRNFTVIQDVLKEPCPDLTVIIATEGVIQCQEEDIVIVDTMMKGTLIEGNPRVVVWFDSPPYGETVSETKRRRRK